MLADWSKLDREVAYKQIGSVQKGGGPARSLCFSLSLSVLMSVPHPCLFCVCVQACKQEAEKERGHERQTETVWGWFWLGSIGAFTLCFVGKSSTGVTNNPPFLSSSTEMHILRHKYTHAQPNWVFYWALPFSALPLSVDSAFIQ